ncbi:MAG: YciI family protein [Acidobacteriota bacterium]
MRKEMCTLSLLLLGAIVASAQGPAFVTGLQGVDRVVLVRDREPTGDTHRALGRNQPLPQVESKPGTQAKPPVFDLDRYQFGILRRGPKWTAESTPETEKIQVGHMENIGKMAATGKLVAAGPMLDNGDLRGIFLFKVDSVDEAIKLAAEDPAIKAGRLTLELLTWMAPRGIGARFSEDYRKDPKTRTTMTRYHLAFLRAKAGEGPPTTSIQEIQLEHLWNIRRMLDSGKLAAAGPFESAGELRGLFVFATTSLEEAKAWAESDPAVKAGLATVELHPWLVAKEVWPTGITK